MATLKSTPAQQFVPIKEVRDGIAILEDGSMRALLITSALNFSLKSQDNQQAIIYQFQSFLNSLDFSIQIFVESRRLDIRPYIALLEERYKMQTSDLFKLQTREYIEFIKKFTELEHIMTKSFFVIVPYSPAIVQAGQGIQNSLSALTGKTTKTKAATNTEQKADIFEENKSQLEQRMGVVESGLTRCGIRVARLGNEEIVELFYKIFNPGETEKPISLATQNS
jgi:hypothetical protein